jgi:hypothetical protein
VPQALDLPSPQQWLFANAALQKEVQDRRELELNLRISDPFALRRLRDAFRHRHGNGDGRGHRRSHL